MTIRDRTTQLTRIIRVSPAGRVLVEELEFVRSHEGAEQNMPETRSSAERGFTLIEVMVAIMILTVGLLSLAQMMVLATNSNSLSGRMTSASALAKEQTGAPQSRAVLYRPSDLDAEPRAPGRRRHRRPGRRRVRAALRRGRRSRRRRRPVRGEMGDRDRGHRPAPGNGGDPGPVCVRQLRINSTSSAKLASPPSVPPTSAEADSEERHHERKAVTTGGAWRTRAPLSSSPSSSCSSSPFSEWRSC